MELYTLDEGFRRENLVESFSEVIWTERFTQSGDITLVVPPTPSMIALLAEGTMLAANDTDEIMVLETALIEDGKLKVTGNTLEQDLANKLWRRHWGHDKRSEIVSGIPGNIIRYLVYHMVMEGGDAERPVSAAEDPQPLGDVGWNVSLQKQIIPGLTAGPEFVAGAEVSIDVPYGPLYDPVLQIAETHQLGLSLYLESADDDEYSLKFLVYEGRDLTSDQDVLPAVQFSPAMDSLTNIKELRSVAGYKKLAYVFAPNRPETMGWSRPGIAEAYPGAALEEGLDRRALMLYADDITVESGPATVGEIQAILDQRAKDALANNNYTKVVDGEIVPQSQFQYGTHYGLGDIVELIGHSGISSKARITEYIRTQDKTGERSYPTVSVIE